MSEITECSVCAEKFTGSVRTKICCNYCSYNACKTCVTRYLLSQVADAHCMNCRTGWSGEFLNAHLTKNFVKGAWRDHKKKMLMNREKAVLPNFQKYASAQKKMIELKPILEKLAIEDTVATNKMYKHQSILNGMPSRYLEVPLDKYEEVEQNCDLQYNEYIQIHKEFVKLHIKYLNINTEYNLYSNIYNDSGSKTEVEKKEFIMKCVKDGCRGFLSQAYKCELCSTYVCKDCMIVKKDKNDETHVCKKEDIDTVSMIRKETKPCPKCGIRISKIDGCDQMWCTAEGCGTAFSWNTGKVINGIIHNPHYYEWMRRNNNGVAPRNHGDMPCGGFPDYYSISTPLRTLGLTNTYYGVLGGNPLSKAVSLIFAIHRCFIDIQEYRIPLYNIARNNMMFKEFHVNFLIGNITEEKWVQSIFMKELNIEKKQAVLTVLQTFLAAGQDIFRGIVTQLNELQQKKVLNRTFVVTIDNFKNINDILTQFEELRNYINKSLVKMGEDVSTPVPQFNQHWICETASSTEKIKEKAKESNEKN